MIKKLMVDLPIWVLLFPLPLLAYILITRDSRSRSTLNLPPGPCRLPIIGNIHQLGTLPYRSLAKLSKIYGPVLYLKIFSIPMVAISSPQTAKQVLNTHDLDCCSRPSSTVAMKIYYDYKDIGFAPYSNYSRDMRKICVSELFSVKRVESFSYIRQEELSLLIDSISESASKGSSVNLSKKFTKLLADVTSRIAFGRNFQGNGIDSETFEHIMVKIVELLMTISASDFFPRVGWLIDRLTGLDKKLETTFNVLDAFLEKIIEDRLRTAKSKGEREDIMDVLLKMEEEEVRVAGQLFTRDHVKSMLMDLFLAGVDTVAATLAWAMTELARHPRVLAKVQHEIRNTICFKERLSEDDINKLEYFNMVIKEIFRIHPPAPLLIPRESISSFQVNGFNIYPKTRILVNVWAIGRDPNVWEDPEQFYPERFINNSIDVIGTSYELLPFGSGRRSCPGQHLARTMLEYTLANILYHFDWKLPDGMTKEDISLEEAPGIVAHKKIHLELVPIKHHWI